MAAEFIEYRVRPVTRYIVTRYSQAEGGRLAGSESYGEFDNEPTALDVMMALAMQEHDPNIVYVGGDGDRQPNQRLADVLASQAVQSADPAAVAGAH